MDMRTTPEVICQKKRNRDILIQEGLTGITKRDILPNKAQPLEKEMEAMYFKELFEKVGIEKFDSRFEEMSKQIDFFTGSRV